MTGAPVVDINHPQFFSRPGGGVRPGARAAVVGGGEGAARRRVAGIHDILRACGSWAGVGENRIADMELASSKEGYSVGETVSINVRFAVRGGIRDAFDEKNWTEAYNNNDNLFKIKYGIKLTSGGFRSRELGTPIDSYRKASIFWTRNPKLVNPMKDKRVWVQVAKNFVPYIRLTEEEVRQELFDFDEEFRFKASELGAGRHRIGAGASASWQKHDYAGAGSVKGSAREIELEIN